jgi:hypothetical protein
MDVKRGRLAIAIFALLAASGLLFDGSAVAAPSGAIFTSSSTPANNFASTSAANKPTTNSSRSHDEDEVECSPAKIKTPRGHCELHFEEEEPHGKESDAAQQVCFSVQPANAGTVSPACVTKQGQGKIEFTRNPSFCGKVRITATEPAENNQQVHTTVTISCP